MNQNPITELVPNTLYAISGSVPADRPTTWLLPSQAGVMPVSCYVLRDGNAALIIDTGLAVHREQIHNGLEAVLAGTSHRALLMTRREPDSIINLPFLVKNINIQTVYCAGILDPLDFFERFDKGNIDGCITAMTRMGVTWIPTGNPLSVGHLQAVPLRTLMAVLPKSHVYETKTRTLFGSDSWGMLAQSAPWPLEQVRNHASLNRDKIAVYLAYKFDWLLGIDTSPIVEDLRQLLGLDIDRICSSYGSVIEGADTVRHVLNETLAAVRILASRPMPNRLRGFNEIKFKHA